MLVMTRNAVEAVQAIVSSSGESSEEGGLRMVANPEGDRMNLQLSVAAHPSEQDEVLEPERGARLFLEPEAAFLLEGKILDASIDEGDVTFLIADQATD